MGNPYRCRTCGSLAGADGYCKTHRVAVGLGKDIPLDRKNFIDRNPGSAWAPVSDKFGTETSTFGIARKDFT